MKRGWRSCPWGFVFQVTTFTKAICRRAANAARHGTRDLFLALPHIECILAIGRYAQDYHFTRVGRPLPDGIGVDETVRRWRDFVGEAPRIIALPHPSWRNNGWLKRNPWFEREVLPMLRTEVARAVS